jgi:hypothetical protein
MIFGDMLVPILVVDFGGIRLLTRELVWLIPAVIGGTIIVVSGGYYRLHLH